MRFETHQFANGFTLAVAEMPYAKTVAAGIWVGVGSRHETPRQNGISHFMEHMLFKGTRTRNQKQIYAVAESVGGEIDADTDEERTAVYLKLPATYARDAYALLLDIFQNPTFSRRHMARERGVILEEVKSGLDDPEQQAKLGFEQTLLAHHPASLPIEGTLKSVRAITRADLQAFHRRHYHAANACMSVAGPTTLREVIEQVRDTVEGLPGGQKQPFAPLPLEPLEPKVCTVHRNLQQVCVTLGMRAVGMANPRAIPLRIASEILASNGSSRLYQRLREREGLVYEVSSGCQLWIDGGMWSIDTKVSASKLVNATGAVFREIDRLANRGPTDKEVEAVKKLVLGQRDAMHETTDGQAAWIADDIISLGRAYTAEEVAQRIAAVCARDVRDSLRHVWGKPGLCIAAVGKNVKQSTLERLARRG